MINISLKGQGRPGIEDGLSASALFEEMDKENGDSAALEFIRTKWWWHSASMPSQLYFFLLSRKDRGGDLAFTYESVARLCGQYPFGPDATFCELVPMQAEDFAGIFGVAENQQFLPAMIDRWDPEPNKFRPIKKGGSGMAEAVEEMHRESLRPYTKPVRFNRLSPKEDLHKALDRLLDEEGYGSSKLEAEFPKNIVPIGLRALETWDWRRWKKDFSTSKEKWHQLEALAAKIWSREKHPSQSISEITKSRAFALAAVKRAQANVASMDHSKSLTWSEKLLVQFVQSIKITND